MYYFFLHARPSKFYTLSLHDALPISVVARGGSGEPGDRPRGGARARPTGRRRDRKSTRLNSSHLGISYAVFCLKKKIHEIECSPWSTDCSTRLVGSKIRALWPTSSSY